MEIEDSVKLRKKTVAIGHQFAKFVNVFSHNIYGVIALLISAMSDTIKIIQIILNKDIINCFCPYIN